MKISIFKRKLNSITYWDNSSTAGEVCSCHIKTDCVVAIIGDVLAVVLKVVRRVYYSIRIDSGIQVKPIKCIIHFENVITAVR